MRIARGYTLATSTFAAACLMAGSAQASLYCEVVATSDGFAAIRSAPSIRASILKKHPKDRLILLDDTRKPPSNAKSWEAVSIEDPATKRIVARGWIHKSLIKSESCG